MNKLLEFAAETAKALLPAAGEAAKHLLSAMGKLAGGIGKAGLSAIKSKGTKTALRKGRKLLRKTALISGCVAFLSCTALILSRKE